MKEISSGIASLKISGKPFVLDPKNMNYDGVRYTVKESGAEISLEISEFDNAFTSLLRISSASSENTSQFSEVKSLDKEFALSGELYFESINGDSCGENSFLPVKKVLSDRIHIEPFGGRPSDTSAFPFFEVHNTEKSYIFAVGWTGQWCADIYKTENGFRACVGLCDSDFYLEPEESVRLPLVLVFEGNEIKSARQEFRVLIFDKFTPRPGGKIPEMPIAIQPFDRYFQGLCDSEINPYWNTEAGQIEEARKAEKCGFDSLWIDASWMIKGFPDGIGNYSYAPGFPNGLKPVADEVHKKGMKFIVWFEPERIVKGTDIYNAHPEWLISMDNSDDLLFNLADKDAAEFLTELLSTKIKENGIDVYRQDFNMSPLEYWRKTDKPGRRGITEMHYVENYYKMLDTLFERFPNLLMDNCSSGGRRLDLEMVKRSVTLWRSDTGCFPEHEEFENTLWNNLQTIVLSRYLPFTCCASWTADAYSVRSVFTGGIALNLDILSDEFSPESVRPIIEECKRCRHYWYGRFIEITAPDMELDKWAAYRLDCENEGCIYYFRKRNAGNDTFSLSPGDFDEDAVYNVKFTDEKMNVLQYEMSGKELSELSVTINQKRGSLLVEYKKNPDKSEC